MFFRILSLAPFLGKAISFFRFFETKRNRYLEERASETYGRRIRQESRNNRWRMFLEGDDEWERDYSAEVFWRKKKRKKEGKRKRKKIMFAHRSTLLVYSLELPFASFIDFFSSRYENSFEWPDGTRGLLKADERVYFSVTENPKWRPDTGTPVEWPYKGNALNSSS